MMLPLDIVVFHCQFCPLIQIFDLLLEMFQTSYFMGFFLFLACSLLFSAPIKSFSNFTGS